MLEDVLLLEVVQKATCPLHDKKLQKFLWLHGNDLSLHTFRGQADGCQYEESVHGCLKVYLWQMPLAKKTEAECENDFDYLHYP